MAPSRIFLEMTEGISFPDSDLVMWFLCELKILRIQLALDDFGIGYNSLSELRRLKTSCQCQVR
ncbi:EAL domain-containing protein [Pengzhenrongella frigida]|uniref:EAL domain-containing protein n=1 Tax=Pengzhenrongella frigida TaxID=1259133 RepID=A0A4Q5MZ44_9MICO|nr:EAL domain-containing protein [Cellulomonas sp. HLT2-17]